MSLEQVLRLSQTLKLSPTLLQSMNILQMNTQELAEYLNDLALENPAMEYAEGPGDQLSWEEFSSQVPWLSDGPGPVSGSDGTIPDVGIVQAEADSLAVLLADQLDRLPLSPPLLALCQYLLDSLDPHGRLDQDDLDGLVRAGVPEDLLQEALETVQSLDPAGIGARSVSECLILQLRRLPGDHTLAVRLCGHLEELARGALPSLSSTLGVPLEALKEAAEVIRSLDPDPLEDVSPAEPVQYICPDAWIAEVDGKLQVFLNQWDLPRFSLNQDYLALSKHGPDQETTEYLKQKVQQAQWVLQCVRRRHDTLERCLTALAQAQAEFFLGKTQAPGPLLRRDLAEQLEVHPSTVTRTLGHKYIQCRQGIFPTGYFFARKTGGEGSEQIVKATISRMIREEDPARPLSDQTIADRLSVENLPVARRTVAKYRQALGIPSSQRRRSTKARLSPNQ